MSDAMALSAEAGALDDARPLVEKELVRWHIIASLFFMLTSM